jgi:ascorbate-specific PTS system EIIC-type component UlaA
MASQHRPSEGLKSIVGGALVGLGLHILFGNLDRVAEQMKHMLGTTAWETLGVLPSAVLAASQAVRAYGLDHQGFLQSLLWMGFWILISFWPLVLVIAGTVLLRNFFTEKAKALPAPEKYLHNKHMGCRFRAFSFDV